MKLRAIVLTGVLVSLFACGDPAEPPVPSSLRAIAGDRQVVTVGEPLGNPLIVEVTDQRGRSMEGVTVRWSATASALSASTVETDAGGRAQVSWTQQGAQDWAMVTAGAQHTCAVTSAGEAFCWGHGGNGQLGNGTPTDLLIPSPVSGEQVWAAVDAGGSHSCGLTTDGAPYCWGENAKGQITGDGRSSIPVKITPP